MVSEFKKFILFFLKSWGAGTENIIFSPLLGDGSKRLFWRIIPPGSAPCFIAMSNPPIDSALHRENLAYVMIGRHLNQKGIPVPKIYQHNLEHGWFIMEDMGKVNLQYIVASYKKPMPIIEKVIEHLFRLQIDGARGFDPAWCCQTERYDRTVMIRYESDYFREAFLFRYLGLKREWPELELSFNYLASIASEADTGFFLHRDFQSRNIMIKKGNIGIIDWQGGRLGPLGYDLASLLIDPYLDLSPPQRKKLYQSYSILLKDHDITCYESFKISFPCLAIQRNLQILGAFSYLTQTMNKPYFEDYIPTALKTLNELLNKVNTPKLFLLKHLINELSHAKN